MHLAQAEIPALACVTVVVEEGLRGSLRGARDFVDVTWVTTDPHTAEAGLTTLLAQIIGLLITFIGEDLALRLVREAWPEIADDHTVLEV